MALGEKKAQKWPGLAGGAAVRARRWGTRQKEGKFSHSQGRGLAGRKPHIAEKCRSRRAKRAVLSSLPPSPVDISSPPPSSPPLALRATVAKRDSFPLLLTSFGEGPLQLLPLASVPEMSPSASPPLLPFPSLLPVPL